MSSNDYNAPIFILGIMPRSGTNLLFNLVRLHPDCGVPEPIWEDYLLEPSHLLIQYAQSVYGWWDSAIPPWGVEKSFEDELCRRLGLGLISFLQSRVGDKRVLTKTPRVLSLENFFRVFPDAYLLILVRDGRDVVDSTVRSFGSDPDGIARLWADGAATIARFDKAARGRGLRYLITRYEDLHAELESEMRRILEFLDLDEQSYDFDAAQKLPVFGSSRSGATEDWVHWNPVEKTSGFRPIGRWQGWTRRQHERFNWLAGDYLNEFGYAVESYSTHRRSWTFYNRVVDKVQRYKPHRIVPTPVWRFVKKGGYQLLRLGGVDVRDGGIPES